MAHSHRALGWVGQHRGCLDFTLNRVLGAVKVVQPWDAPSRPRLRASRAEAPSAAPHRLVGPGAHAAGELPPVNAFWSVAVYDEDGFQVANPRNRFALGDRDGLSYNADGSVDLFSSMRAPVPSGRRTGCLPHAARLA